MTLITLPVFNNTKLDDEHRDIVLFLYQIKDDKRDLPKIINTFLFYVTEHYVHEEQFMIDNNYPTHLINAHVNEHNKLKELFSKTLLSNINNMSDNIIDALRITFIDHMNNWDRLIAEWIKNEKGKKELRLL